MITVFFGWIGAAWSSDGGAQTERGRETYVEIPLDVLKEARPQLLKLIRQTKLKEALRKVPVYAELLDEFPDATIAVLKSK